MEIRRRLLNTTWMVAFAFATIVGGGEAARGGDITGIVSFGDSLTDVGNTYLAFGAPTSPPYYMGHYSNGPIWLEYLAGQLGVPAPTASYGGGTDNAWGGAQTGDGYSVQGTPNIGLQISTYLATNTLSSTQLITVWGGANDFLNAGVTDPTIPVSNLASDITTLANAGGKLFMVPNLPLLGDIPATNSMPQSERDALNALSVGFDSLLQNELNTLQHSLGITIYQPNIEALFENVLANPSAYGFTNVTDSLLYSGDPTQSGYLFWDYVHPTTQAGQLIGAVAYDSIIPEPSALTLVLIAAPVVLLAWRRMAKNHVTRFSAHG